MSKKQAKTIIPSWAMAPFHRFMAQSGRLWEVTRLTCLGLTAIQTYPKGLKKALETIARYDEKYDSEKDSPKHEEQLKRAKKDSKLAENEINAGFPLVYSNAIVTLWSLLEAMTRSMVVAWLKNERSSFQGDSINRLRIRIGDYEQLTEAERHHYIAELLETDVAAGLRYGIDRFEALLKPIGLDGAAPEKLRRNIFEFGQVRNAIAHRGGTTDRQLSNACPWLNFPIGEELPIIREHFDRYWEASLNYLILLVSRSATRFGGDSTKDIQEVFDKYDSRKEGF
ncbi:MAG: hypothetical protein R3B95_01640 [Nitrospirales bacterium]|nr:hypothetical protein [Nitrospirales bacterium]